MTLAPWLLRAASRLTGLTLISLELLLRRERFLTCRPAAPREFSSTESDPTRFINHLMALLPSFPMVGKAQRSLKSLLPGSATANSPDIPEHLGKKAQFRWYDFVCYAMGASRIIGHEILDPVYAGRLILGVSDNDVIPERFSFELMETTHAVGPKTLDSPFDRGTIIGESVTISEDTDERYDFSTYMVQMMFRDCLLQRLMDSRIASTAANSFPPFAIGCQAVADHRSRGMMLAQQPIW